MHVFSRKLCWGYATVGKVRYGRWVCIFLLKKKEVKEEKKKKKLKRETLR